MQDPYQYLDVLLELRDVLTNCLQLLPSTFQSGLELCLHGRMFRQDAPGLLHLLSDLVLLRNTATVKIT